MLYLGLVFVVHSLLAKPRLVCSGVRVDTLLPCMPNLGAQVLGDAPLFSLCEQRSGDMNLLYLLFDFFFSLNSSGGLILYCCAPLCLRSFNTRLSH